MNIGFPIHFRFCAYFVAALLLAASSVSHACQVPVFRYALERWEADHYSLVITPGKSGELSVTEKEVFSYLSEIGDPGSLPVNFTLSLSEKPDASSESATLSLAYPQKVRGRTKPPIWSGPTTTENAERLVNSPVRKAIVDYILAGKSAVWLLVESGDTQIDSDIDKILATVTSEAPQVLKISEDVIPQSELDSLDTRPAGHPIDPEDILQSTVPLKIDFATIRLSRENPDEAIFLAMLLNLEEDLADFGTEPMVFPVFGRGRALEPLIGRAITTETVMDFAGYLCGACSCEVKDLNPGMDLLVAADWNSALDGSEIIIEKVLPPLEGLNDLKPVGETVSSTGEVKIEPAGIQVMAAHGVPFESFVEVDLDTTSINPSLGLWTTVAGILIAGVLVIGTVFILRDSS